jgi:hypothetical protein
VPRMAKEDLLGLLSVADVMLDPFPWGAGLTSLEVTLVVGTVIAITHRACDGWAWPLTGGVAWGAGGVAPASHVGAPAG